MCEIMIHEKLINIDVEYDATVIDKLLTKFKCCDND